MAKDMICSLLFLINDTDILLARKKRGLGVGKLNGVGGKIEPGETIEQTMIRECQEEILVTPTNYDKVAELSFVMDCDTQEPWNIYIHAYTADQWQGEPTETDEMAPEWHSQTDIPYHEMWQDDMHWLPQVLTGQKVTGQFTFNQEQNLLSHNIQLVASFK